MDRRAKRFGVIAIAAVLISTVLGSAPASAAAGGVYVALGDSSASGPGILPQLTLDPCWRSARNYPHVAASLLGVSVLRDVTCSGAKTDHMTQSPSGVAPQFGALTADTTLVSLSIGGNDTGLLGLGESCIRLNPFERPCYYDNVVNGVDLVNQRIDAYAPKLAATLAGIGVIPTTIAAPLHPNARGMQAIGEILAAAAR